MAHVTTTRPHRTPGTRSRTGRRTGDSGTRDQILEAARGRFAEHGFAGTTIRAVAADAGVDPALVHHFYGSKDDLFAAAVALPIDPDLLPAVVAGDPSRIGERFVRFYLSLWEDPTTGPTLLAVFRSAVSHDRAAALLREFVAARLLQRVAGELRREDGSPVDDAERRVALAASQLVGVALVRYVVGVPQLRDADLDRVVADVAPTVQRYLTGDLPA